MSTKKTQYYDRDGALLAVEEGGHGPRIYRGNGNWEAYGGAVHEAEPLTEDEATELMAELDSYLELATEGHGPRGRLDPPED
jgi:hypothetical protein